MTDLEQTAWRVKPFESGTEKVTGSVQLSACVDVLPRCWKDPIWSPEKADFRLSCACPTFKWMTILVPRATRFNFHRYQKKRRALGTRMMNDQRTSWNFTSGHLYCLSNQSISILWRNFRESLVSWSLRSNERRLEVRDWIAPWPIRPFHDQIWSTTFVLWFVLCTPGHRLLPLITGQVSSTCLTVGGPGA